MYKYINKCIFVIHCPIILLRVVRITFINSICCSKWTVNFYYFSSYLLGNRHRPVDSIFCLQLQFFSCYNSIFPLKRLFLFCCVASFSGSKAKFYKLFNDHRLLVFLSIQLILYLWVRRINKERKPVSSPLNQCSWFEQRNT